MWVWQLILPTLVCICIYQRRAVRSATPTTQLSVRSTWLSEVSCVTDDGRGQLHHWNTHHDELQQKYKQLIIFIASWWYSQSPYTTQIIFRLLLMLLQVKSGIPSGCVQGESGHLSTVEGLGDSAAWTNSPRCLFPWHLGTRLHCITSLWSYVYGLEHIKPIATRHTMAHFSFFWSLHTSTVWVAPSLGNDWLTTVTRLLLTPLTQEQSAEHCKDLGKIHKCVCEWDIVWL